MMLSVAPSPSPKPLSADRAREHLATGILAGRIGPSEKINIKTVAEEIDVSLGAVREALSRLAAEGFVTSLPQKGYCAAPVSRTDLTQLTEARVEIETTCACLSLARGDVEWESEVAAAYHALTRTDERVPGDATGAMSPDWARVHGRFHDAIARGCGNAWLLSLRQTLFAQSERYRRLSYPLSRAKRDIPGEHRLLFEAVMARDEARTAEALSSHLNRTAEMILNSEFLA